MAEKRGSSSETIIAVIVVVGLALLLGYYIYQEEIPVYKKISEPEKTAVKVEPTEPEIIKIPSTLKEMLPISNSGNQVVHHFAYSLAYDEEAEQAEWLAYMLTDDHLNGKERRNDNFKEDTLVETGSASNEDYYRTGYDKGHLAPAADFKWSKQAMDESFYLSNISPQMAGFNRGIWKDLEEQIREWAAFEETLFVVTGALLHDDLPVIGENEVAVPEFFYKVVFDASQPEYKGIAFILKNERTKEPLANFAVSIDSVESFTGIDFFPGLPDILEDNIEKNGSIYDWPVEE